MEIKFVKAKNIIQAFDYNKHNHNLKFLGLGLFIL